MRACWSSLHPHVIRGTQAAGHSPMMRIERGPNRTLANPADRNPNRKLSGCKRNRENYSVSQSLTGVLCIRMSNVTE